MDVSVVVCTRNRAESLRRTLETMAGMNRPAGTGWELVVVDNGSTDDTAAVVSAFAGVLPVKLVCEPAAGLSNARNAGVAAAAGTYIVWTDDDVDVGPDWLAAYCRAFKAWPGGVVFGGPITPLLEAPAPAWFAENIDTLHLLLATRDFGGAARPLCVKADVLPFGANFAIRAAEQKRCRYNPALGAGPGNLRLGEETVLIKQILRGGAEGYWVPQARVAHRIARARQSLAYVEDYFARLGRTVAHGKLAEADYSYLGARLRHFVAIVTNRGLLAARPWLPARIWLPRLMSLAFHKGALEQLANPRAA
jgi:glycosyltransferase involved in cell wall biosynthesis